MTTGAHAAENRAVLLASVCSPPPSLLEADGASVFRLASPREDLGLYVNVALDVSVIRVHCRLLLLFLLSGDSLE